MISGSQEMIRDINRRLVLEKIVNNGPISRAALAKALHLTKATISNIVQELLIRNWSQRSAAGILLWGENQLCWPFHRTAGMPWL